MKVRLSETFQRSELTEVTGRLLGRAARLQRALSWPEVSVDASGAIAGPGRIDTAASEVFYEFEAPTPRAA